MVLTNFELWAADGASAASSLPLEFESSAHNRHLNPFDPRVVPVQINSNLTHISSNGYYGFSYINAAHNMEELNNNNNNAAYNFMANDVNGMNNTASTMSAITTTIPTQTHAASATNFECAANVAGDVAAKVTRCKKRFFVRNDADVENECTAGTEKNHTGFAKRCRFDDDFAAQYCNDFFSLPSTQIATQSCYMDTEEGFHLNPQQQVVGAMFENNNNIGKHEQNSHQQLQNQIQQEQSQNTTQSIPSQHQNEQQPSLPQQQHLYHQQQHYQDMITTIKCHFNNSCDTIPLTNNHTCIKIDSQNTEKNFKSHKSDFKVDDATLFAQIHGGFMHHFIDTITTTTSTNNKDVVKQLLQDENYFEEF